MPDGDRALSLLTGLTLLPGCLLGLLLRSWCFSTVEDVPSILIFRHYAAEGPRFA
jgi:hypothetical protein